MMINPLRASVSLKCKHATIIEKAYILQVAVLFVFIQHIASFFLCMETKSYSLQFSVSAMPTYVRTVNNIKPYHEIERNKILFFMDGKISK